MPTDDKQQVLPGAPADNDDIDNMIDELKLRPMSAQSQQSAPPTYRSQPNSPRKIKVAEQPTPDVKMDSELDKMSKKLGNQVDSWTTVFGNLMTTTTLHGIKYVADDHRWRKIIWMSLVLLAFILFFAQSIARVVEYYNYKTTINVQVLNNLTMVFPAVTICNQNLLRMTATNKLNLFESVNTFFDYSQNIEPGKLTFPQPTMTSVEEIDGQQTTVTKNMDMTHFLLQGSHQLNDLIDQCTWNGHACNASDFTSVVTDMGVCYSFNADASASKAMSNPGAQNGLRLLLNIEMYNHMNGPTSAAGVKILLHDPDQKPMVKDLGISLPSGTHTLIGIKMEKMNAMEPPWGTCSSKALKYSDEYSYSSCIIECVGKAVQDRCGCVAAYMEPNVTGGPKSCGIQDNFDCVEPLLADYQQVVKDCDCPLACERNIYDTSISYSTLANIMGVVKKGNNMNNIKSNLLEASETSQRVDATIRQADESVLNSLLTSLTAPALNDVEALYTYGEDGEPIDPFSYVLDDFMTAADYTGPDDWQRMRAMLKTKKMLYEATYGRQVSSLKTFLSEVLDAILELVNDDMLTTSEVLGLGMTSPDQPSLITGLANAIDQTKLAARKIGKLITVFEADPSNLYKEFSAEDLALLPRNMMLEAEPLTKEMSDYLFSYIIGINWVNVNTTDYLNQLNDSFYELHDTLVDMSGTTDLQWGIDGSGFNFTAYSLVLIEIKGTTGHLSQSVLPYYSKQVDWFHDRYLYINFQVTTWYLEAFNNFQGFRDRYKAENVKIKMLRSVLDAEKAATEAKIQAFKSQTLTKAELADYLSFEKVDSFKSSLDTIVSSLANLEYSRLIYRTDLKDYMEIGWQTVVAWYIMVDTDQLTDELFLNMTQPYFAKNGGTVDGEDCAVIIDKILPRAKIMTDSLESRWNHTKDATACLMAAWEPVHEKGLLKVNGQSLSGVIANEVRSIKNSYDAVQERLSEYVNNIQMDENFFLRNFMQLDVFYEEFRYEEVTQQEAFALLSLYGELGGFMGLLLGGSLLTVFEFIDALLVNCFKKARSKKTVQAFDSKA